MVHLCSSKVHIGGLANFTAIEKCWPTKQAKANIENCRFLVLLVQPRLPQFFKLAGKQFHGGFLQASVSQASRPE